ncbi:MAG: hypothetical protein AB7S94_05165 [Simkaniaceae bacterium]
MPILKTLSELSGACEILLESRVHQGRVSWIDQNKASQHLQRDGLEKT